MNLMSLEVRHIPYPWKSSLLNPGKHTSLSPVVLCPASTPCHPQVPLQRPYDNVPVVKAVTNRLADVWSSLGSAASGLNLDQTWRSGPGRTANLDLDLGSGPVRVRTRFDQSKKHQFCFLGRDKQCAFDEKTAYTSRTPGHPEMRATCRER